MHETLFASTEGRMLGLGIGTQEYEPIKVRDSLAADPGERFDVVLTNPPFGKKSSRTIVGEAGSLCCSNICGA